ncbi:unnamed protein product [Chrysodeixis includens]|uniref:Peptidase S1 domain-containing protein n=1 Tax=Chrysodeixis includens TaxID=689277 RepID=A0A9P0BXX7_CHRIL|nr:unnamed protein product [Chrysodeixis includens]
MFKLIILCVVFVFSEAGNIERCMKNGKVGTCKPLLSCRTAIEDLKNKIHPKICSFDKMDPIVCCLDDVVGTLPVPLTTTTESSVSIPQPYPDYDYQIPETNGTCPPLPPGLSANKTRQRAFNRCIEYQDKYIYPCEQGVPGRVNKCHYDPVPLILVGPDRLYDLPHMVQIGFGSPEELQWLCGGALISEKHILTVAHCSQNRQLGPPTHILVGAFRRARVEEIKKVYKIKKITTHPQYKAPGKYHDIALLETENVIKLDQYVVPACLPVGDDVNDDRVIAAGWGHNQMSSSESSQQWYMKKFTKEHCTEVYPPTRQYNRGFDPQSQSCYGEVDSSQKSCLSKSGSPIQIKNRQIHCMYTVVGVTLFQGICLSGEPRIFTRVANYVPWIENIVWPN